MADTWACTVCGDTYDSDDAHVVLRDRADGSIVQVCERCIDDDIDRELENHAVVCQLNGDTIQRDYLRGLVGRLKAPVLQIWLADSKA